MKTVMVKVKVKSQVVIDRVSVLGQAPDFTLGMMVNKRRQPCFSLITFPECMVRAGHSSKYITHFSLSHLCDSTVITISLQVRQQKQKEACLH